MKNGKGVHNIEKGKSKIKMIDYLVKIILRWFSFLFIRLKPFKFQQYSGYKYYKTKRKSQS
jgi:hypothetical protein